MKLNMGCGAHKIEGWVNVDMFPESNPDVVCDLEKTPWLWESDSVSEMRFIHSLEHMGGDPKVFLNIVKELYRVCKDGARIYIAVPHPRHDHFLDDPTHVRIITPEMMGLFSKKKNLAWIREGYSNSPLALYIDVDFEVENARSMLAEPYRGMYDRGEISNEDLAAAVRERNNILQDIQFELKVIKPPTQS
jgi:hypothetical protein